MVKTRTKWLTSVVCLVGAVVFGVNVFMVLQPHSPEPKKCEPGFVPKIGVQLYDITLDDLNSGKKDTKYPGNTVEVTTCGTETSYNDVEIKGRGNSTWTQEKKPYQIKFDEKIDLFGMGKAKKWVLLANAFDGSNLRTDVAFYLEKMLGEPFALKGEFVELSINGEYLGLYYLTQKIEISKTRINLSDSLGILVELDNLHKDEEYFETAGGNRFQVKDLVYDDNLSAAQADLTRGLKNLRSAVERKDLAAVEKYIDLDSMVRYYLLSEFSSNPDAYCSSFYMYKDGADDKIHLGPGWDFDFGFGNREWVWGKDENFFSPYGQTIKEYFNSKKYKYAFWIVESDEFEELVGKMYREKMAGRKQEILDYIDERADYIYQAALHNEALWDGHLDADLEYLKDWISKRFDYFEELYGGMGNLEKVML